MSGGKCRAGACSVCLLLVTMAHGAVAHGTVAVAAVQTPPLTRVVAVGGETVLTLRGTNEAALQSRADAIEERLRFVLSHSELQSSDIRVVKQGSEVCIYALKRLVVTVTAEDARLNDTRVLPLAQKWAAELAIQLPKLKVRAEPPGQ